MVSVSTLLNHLPTFQDKELIIEHDQGVHDIIKEVIDAHKVFAEDYDSIAKFFSGDPKQLFDFCKRNISYSVETEEDQTTRSPAAILTLAHGDCKHYAGFIAGVLDAITRQGQKINWRYRFASYDLFNTAPGHVFVVVKENGEEVWVDPVLTSYNERLIPSYITDKKVIGMLTRLSGIGAEAGVYREEPIAALAYNADDPALYNAITVLYNSGVMNADGTVNVDSVESLEKVIPPAELNAVIKAFNIANDAAVAGLGANIAHALAKVTLFIPRSAYLSLVALNVFGLASKLFHCIYLDDSATTYYQPGQDTIYRKWYLVGGDWDRLAEAVRSGHKKKAILSGIGVAPAIPVWVVSATAIIAALGAAISQVLKSRGAQTGIDYNLDPATGLPYGIPGTNNAGGGSGSAFDLMTFLKDNALLIGGSIAAYLYFKKKRA